MTTLVLILLLLEVCIFATLFGQPFSCGSPEYLTIDNGVIDSHGGHAAGLNYGKNMDCVWTIEAPTDMYVDIWPETFDVEDDSRCNYDYLELLDGRNINAEILGIFCGSSIEPGVSSTHNFLTVHFVTDDDVQMSGFRLHYNFTNIGLRVCDSGEFRCNNSRCVSSLYTCDGDDDCGDASDEQFCPNTNITCPTDEFQCMGSTACIPVDWLCDGDTDCRDASDELPANCQTVPVTARPSITGNSSVCGQLNWTGASGTITSPTYPSNYGNSIICQWRIQGPPGTKSISLAFDDMFSVEPDSSCSYDYVVIFSQDSSRGPYCGDTSPGRVTLPGDQAVVEFSTDDSATSLGFSIDWHALSGKFEICGCDWRNGAYGISDQPNS